MPSITDNIAQLRDRIGDLERRYHRASGTTTLLAVSKRQPVAAIREAMATGQYDFAESYLSEALDKMAEIANEEIRWHFIGPVQSNKTGGIAANFSWVHSIDRLKTARRLSEQRPPHLPPLNVCVQINSSEERTKSGVCLDEAEALCDAVEDLDSLALRGLMAIPEACNGFEQQRLSYRRIATLFVTLKPRYSVFDTLSIGMSGDFEAAIAEGSTLVRIGTALFGER
ncbi:MAG: YggS family pyridoxal phosphate-dependent enzyme [Pseudohongiellaceae bacterium]